MRLNNDVLRIEVERYLPLKCPLYKNVLIIDDEIEQLNSFKAMFRKKLNVFTASGLKESLYLLRNNDIDIIFCDYRLDGVDGFNGFNGADVMHEIIKEYPKIERVILTGINCDDTRREFLEKSGTTRIVEKPLTFNGVLEEIINFKFNAKIAI